jgi:endonuclease/exonuclease/phosphatase (EEP) superfamily protein YafD
MSTSTFPPSAPSTVRAVGANLPTVLAWASAAGLLVLLIIEQTWLSSRWTPLVVLAVLTPVLPFVAAASLAVGLLTRQRALTAVAAVALVGVLWSMRPVLPIHHRPAAPDGPDLRIGSANVFFDNPDKPDAVRRLLSQNLDVLVVPEYTDAFRRVFENEGVADRYPFRVESPVRGGSSGIALFSRFPLRNPRYLSFGHHAVEAELTVDGAPVTILAVHTVAPWQSALPAWRDGLAAIGTTAEAVQGPLIVAGDFNATPYHPAFRRLVDGPLDDAAEDLGEAWRLATWPAGKPWPPYAMIDHVLVNRGAVPTSLRTVTVPGSDHRMLEATVRIARTTP